MEKTLEFPVLLHMIDERASAFRAAVMSAPDLDPQVPTCPDWKLLDLAQHLGNVHRFWAAAVDAGPAEAPPAEAEPETAPLGRDAVLAWSAESTRLLLDALRQAGPDRGCWTWWGGSRSPQTAGAVARHQVQELLVHTYDAQITVGEPQPLPGEAALDGVDEFLTTCCEGTDPWPHGTAAIDFHATEGRSWRLSLSTDGARTTELPAPGDALPVSVPAATATGSGSGSGSGERPDDVAFASASGTAAELVLVLYNRIPIDSLQLGGDRRQLELLRDWE